MDECNVESKVKTGAQAFKHIRRVHQFRVDAASQADVLPSLGGTRPRIYSYLVLVACKVPTYLTLPYLGTLTTYRALATGVASEPGPHPMFSAVL